MKGDTRWLEHIADLARKTDCGSFDAEIVGTYNEFLRLDLGEGRLVDSETGRPVGDGRSLSMFLRELCQDRSWFESRKGKVVTFHWTRGPYPFGRRYDRIEEKGLTDACHTC